MLTSVRDKRQACPTWARRRRRAVGRGHAGTFAATFAANKKSVGSKPHAPWLVCQCLILKSARHAWLFDLWVGKGKIKPRKIKAETGLHMDWREYMQNGVDVNSTNHPLPLRRAETLPCGTALGSRHATHARKIEAREGHVLGHREKREGIEKGREEDYT